MTIKRWLFGLETRGGQGFAGCWFVGPSRKERERWIRDGQEMRILEVFEKEQGNAGPRAA